MNEIPFNINMQVKVKLTPVGVAELKRQDLELRRKYNFIKSVAPEYKTDDYTSFQLHDLMNRLGSLCHIGLEPPFETEIFFICGDKDAKP